jgi:hypothetical protein
VVLYFSTQIYSRGLRTRITPERVFFFYDFKITTPKMCYNIRMKKGKLNNNLISKLAMGFLKDIGTNRCFYCDSLTECREHIIPASYFTVRQKENMILVDSCRLCNSLARDYVPYSCIDKKDWIKERFFQKYEKLLLQRDWDDEDIEELEGSLKSYIRGGEMAKNELRIRYDNLCTLNFYGKDKENVKSFDYKIMLILTGKLE